MDIKIERTNLSSLVVNRLPDGSRVLVDSANETVFALDPVAGAAWDACREPATLSAIAERIQGLLDPQVAGELAREAISALEDKKLVRSTGGSLPMTRRRVAASLGAALALPLVVSLTMADQKAYARNAGSVQLGQHPAPKPLRPAPRW